MRGREAGNVDDYTDQELEVIVHILMGARGYLCRQYAYTEGSAHAVPEYVDLGLREAARLRLVRQIRRTRQGVSARGSSSERTVEEMPMAIASANPFALEDQTILIAGAANGIGASAAAACAALARTGLS